MYYFNFTESEFCTEEARKWGMIGRVCIACETYAQVEELERNATRKNKEAGRKKYQRMTVSRHIPKARHHFSTYADYSKLHD